MANLLTFSECGILKQLLSHKWDKMPQFILLGSLDL